MVIADGKLVSVNKDQAVCSGLQGSSYAVGSFNYRKILAYADVTSGVGFKPIYYPNHLIIIIILLDS